MFTVYHTESSSRYSFIIDAGDDTDSTITYETVQSLKRKEPKKHFITQRLVSVLDTYRLSDRAAIHVITAVIESLRLSINDYVLSRDTIRIARKEERRKIASSVKENFKVIFLIFYKIECSLIFNFK